jgi:hypothetical protein
MIGYGAPAGEKNGDKVTGFLERVFKSTGRAVKSVQEKN